MVKLICDLNISTRGHNAGYAQYVVDHINVRDGEQVYFLFNKSARDILTLAGSALPADHFYFTDDDFHTATLYDKLKFKEWKVIEAFAARLKIDKLFLLDLTHYEIQLGRSNTSFTISGIEFRPSHRIKAMSSQFSVRVSTGLQKYKRRFFETLLLRASSLESIFILNDPTGVESLNKTYRTNVFKYLVDPIYDYGDVPEAENDLPAISRDKVIFIIFGSLDGRKNIAHIFDAFSRIDPALHPDMTLLVAGKIPAYFREEFRMLKQKLTAASPHLELTVMDRFISNTQMEYLYNLSDVSLVIYSKFYGSSGLLGRAAKYNTISLVPNVGLMAELCNDYKLGYLCDPNSPEDIGAKILLAYRDIRENRRISGVDYYRNHSPGRFIELLNL